MKHVNLGDTWVVEDGAFVACLDYGKYQKQRMVIPMRKTPSLQGGIELLKHSFAIGIANDSPIIINDKTDTSDRLLLMGGVKGGFRGGVERIDPHPEDKDTLICSIHAGNKIHSAIAFMCILPYQGSILFKSWDRYGNITIHKHQYKNHKGHQYSTYSSWDEYNAIHDLDGEYKTI